MIQQYIADKVPEKKLAPANGTIERYRLQEWLNLTTSELHKSFSPLFNPTMPDEAKAIFRDKISKTFSGMDPSIGGSPETVGYDLTQMKTV